MSASNRPPSATVYRVIGAGLAAVALLLSMTASSLAATTPQGWHRLNVHSVPAEHEQFRCLAGDVWRCHYNKLPEPNLGFAWDSTRGTFVGVETTADWECPTWFPAEACDAADTVVSGTAEFTFPRNSGGFTVSQQLLVGDNGDLWIYWVDNFQFVCPWYSSFAEATPENSECTFL